MSPAPRPTLVRIALLSGVAVLALLSTTSWSLPRWSGWRTRDRLELVVASVDGGRTVVLDEVLPVGTEVRLAGTVTRPCHLIAFALTPTGAAQRLGARDEDEPAPIEPGPFRLPGGAGLDPTSGGTVRIWAVCGHASLRFSEVAELARNDLHRAGWGEAIDRADRLDLPAGTLQASRLLRFGFAAPWR